MTYVDDPQRDEYTATSGQTVFAYTYRILDQAHLKVYNEGVLQTLTTHYTVSGVGDHGGGNVTFVSGVTLSNTVIILRDTTNDQNVDYTVGGAFPAESNEQALDKVTMQCQDNKEALGRAIKLPVTSTLEDIDLPDGSTNASQLFRWNAAGTALEAVSASTIAGQGASITTDIYRYIADPDQTDQGASSTNSIKAHIDTIAGVSESILCPPGTYTFSTSETVPSNITLVMQSGAVFSVDSGKVLTVNGHMEAPINRQIMSGSGTIVFGQGGVETVYPEWWGIDGTADEVQINQALTSLTCGTVRLLAATYTTAATITGIDDVHLIGNSTGGTVITYSGSVAALTITSLSGVRFEDFHINVSDYDADCILIKNGCRRLYFNRMLLNNTATGPNHSNVLGAGFHFQDDGSWTGGCNIVGCKVNTMKYGIKLVNSSVTAVSVFGTFLVGTTSGMPSGSAGIYVDGNAGAVGSQFIGGTIEAYESGHEVIAGSKGFTINCDFENNTNNYELPDSFNSDIASNNGGWYLKQGHNGGSIVYKKEFHKDGVMIREGYYDQKIVHTGPGTKIGPGSGGKISYTFNWGGTGNSMIDSNGATIDSSGDVINQVLPQGGFVGSGGHATSTAENSYVIVKNHKIAFGNAVPVAGAWVQGDMIIDTTMAASSPWGWGCVTTGQFEAVSTTCDTDGSTAVVTNVAALTNIEVGSYIEIAAGFATTGPFRVLEKNTTTSALTLDTNSNSSQTGTAVTNTSPTFKATSNLVA